jgi:hypothetical protein
MRLRGFGRRRRRMVERSDFGGSLPDCCPRSKRSTAYRGFVAMKQSCVLAK